MEINGIISKRLGVLHNLYMISRISRVWHAKNKLKDPLETHKNGTIQTLLLSSVNDIKQVVYENWPDAHRVLHFMVEILYP